MTVISDFNNKDTGEYENNGEVLLKADFNNDGLTTFNPDHNGYTRFEGFQAQKITGTVPSEFKNLLFYNTNPQPAFQLSGDIIIFGNSDFNQGIVNTDDFGGTITFEQNATHTNTWNGSHVDGDVIKIGSTDFQYPIGDKNFYRYARISAPAEITDTFSGKYFFENSDPLYSHANKQPEIGLINDKEYWTIEKIDSASDILLTLSWDETETTPNEIVASPENEIHIVRWDGTQNRWVDEGGVANIIDKTVTTAVEVSGYGVFTLARVWNDDASCIKIYNGVSPNGDTNNDYFYIECINNYPNNTVEIFDRWGVKVYSTKNYDSNGNVFAGYSNGRSTIDGNKALPSGTYFYVLTYESQESGNKRTHKKAGYLHLNAD
jgi:gliding motility-associated-like protein